VQPGVDADRRVRRELDHVQDRLAPGGHQRLGALVERPVADGDDLDRNAVRVLDLGDGRVERRGQRGAGVSLGMARMSVRRELP
jgi:hypothetical protein